MLQHRSQYIGEIISTLGFLGLPAFVACVAWSFAVGASLLPGLIAGGFFGAVFGLFIPLATHRPGQAAGSLVLAPVLFILAALGGVVWLVRAVVW